MRLFAVILASLGFLAHGKPLLVVIDSDTARQPYIEAWWRQVASEGNFELAGWYNVSPVSWSNETARVVQIKQIEGWIKEKKPYAVQIIGRVAMPATGSGAPDGHPESMTVYWTDIPYAFGHVPFTDLQDRVTNGLLSQLNRKGDGRGDRTYYTFYAPNCVVARVSFDGMPGMSGQPVTYPCYQGPPVPPVDEGVAMKAYFERNLAWRQGRVKWTNAVVWCERPFEAEISWPVYRTNLSFLTIIDSRKQALKPWIRHRILMFGNLPEWLWLWQDPETCDLGFALWAVNYRSFAFGMYDHRQGLRRPLLLGALVSVWGSDFWRFRASSTTVADDIDYSWRRPQWEPNQSDPIRNGLHALYTVAGDLTLPNNPIFLARPTPVSGLRIEP